MQTLLDPAKMTKRQLLAEGNRILNKFHKYAADGYCPGDICRGWDWPTMHIVFPDEASRWWELQEEWTRRRDAGLKAYQKPTAAR